MSEETKTSAETSATPASDPQPATGTPASQGATPQKPTLTLEEALKRLAELEHSYGNAKEELERHRKKLSAYEKKEAEAEAARKAAEEAQLSEIDRTKKQYTELQASYEALKEENQKVKVHSVLMEQAHKLNIIDPDAAITLTGASHLEIAEDPSKAEKVLKDLLKNKPYLAPEKTEQQQTPTPAQTATPTRRPPAISPMSPNRTETVAPNSRPPGQVPSWNDIYKRP